MDEDPKVVKVPSETERLRAALVLARETIKAWHDMATKKGISTPPAYIEHLWDLYQASPEMKTINEAIGE